MKREKKPQGLVVVDKDGLGKFVLIAAQVYYNELKKLGIIKLAREIYKKLYKKKESNYFT